MLVIEVLSPTTWHRDLGVEMGAYAEAGVEHYWVVAPTTRSVTTYRLSAQGSYDEVDHVQGDDVLRVTKPLELTLRPSDLFGSAG